MYQHAKPQEPYSSEFTMRAVPSIKVNSNQGEGWKLTPIIPKELPAQFCFRIRLANCEVDLAN